MVELLGNANSDKNVEDVRYAPIRYPPIRYAPWQHRLSLTMVFTCMAYYKQKKHV